jgi:iron complex transport system ATP-binding protein
VGRAYLLRDGQRIAEGGAAEVLTLNQLQALYRAPVETLNDPVSGKTVFLLG